jgi:hypothetical protein
MMANSSTPTVQPKPVLVEILTYAPTQFFHCQHCEFVWQQVGTGAALHQEQLDSSIPDNLKQEYSALSRWVRNTVATYGGRVVFKLIDAASLEGMLKSVRYRARRYPAFIVEGAEKYIGTDFEQVKALIDHRLS